MIKETWEEILQGRDVRQNLSKLRKEIKEGGGRAALLNYMAGQEKYLIGLLGDEDAKTRKNAALLMGDLGKQDFLEPVYQAYLTEQQMFVKSSYLTSIKNFDYREYLQNFKDRLSELADTHMTDENKKHVMEEIRELNALVVRLEGVRMHEFCGKDEAYDIVLLTNRNFPELTLEELQKLEPQAKAKIFNAGVTAKVRNLNWNDDLRTYQELLFTVKGMKTCPMDPVSAAAVIVNSELFQFLAKSHRGEPPYYFRVEFKSKMDLGKRSAFAKKLAGQIELLSERKLINSTSNYELELRLIENKEGSCNVLIKLSALRDERFTYRKEVIATSIRPANAALTAALAKEYMKEDAAVLDPFCGVGTMLIERHKAVRANTSYGIDILEEAVEKARENTKRAGQIIHYINRDFFDFTHEYRFDEVITDMPFKMGRTTEDDILGIYEHFFPKAYEFLKDDGTIIMYSHDRGLVKRLAPEYNFKIVKEFEVSKKEGSYVVVLKR